MEEILNRITFQGMSINEKREKLNREYAEKFADVQNNSVGMEKKFLELYSGFGISLMRKNKTTQNWEKLVIENNTVTPKPCE